MNALGVDTHMYVRTCTHTRTQLVVYVNINDMHSYSILECTWLYTYLESHMTSLRFKSPLSWYFLQSTTQFTVGVCVQIVTPWLVVLYRLLLACKTLVRQHERNVHSMVDYWQPLLWSIQRSLKERRCDTSAYIED